MGDLLSQPEFVLMAAIQQPQPGIQSHTLFILLIEFYSPAICEHLLIARDILAIGLASHTESVGCTDHIFNAIAGSCPPAAVDAIHSDLA